MVAVNMTQVAVCRRLVRRPLRAQDARSGHVLWSGAVLREVGTTNKTHTHDYRGAVGPDTALLLKVHTSNFQVIGFTSSVSTAALAAIGTEENITVMGALGSGCGV